MSDSAAVRTGDRAVILDVDGTLVDSTYLHALAWTRAFRAADLDVQQWRVHRAIGMGGDRLVTEVCGEAVEHRLGDDLRDAWRRIYQSLRNEIRPLPGVRRFVSSVRDDGVRIAVASSGSRDDTSFALDVAGVADLVDVVVTGDDIDRSKPAPDAIEQSWQRVGSGAALVIGDSVYDAEAAARLDLPFIGVRTGGISADELDRAGALRTFDDLGSLVAMSWEELTTPPRRD